jgi:hypothetical protein
VARTFRQLALIAEYAQVIRRSDDVPVLELPLDERARQEFQRRMETIVVTGDPLDTSVSVVSIRMDSPLVAVVEIPAAVWLGAAVAFLALAERIATLPVRIARKRKEELLKIAIADAEIERVNARADALGLLLLDEGPRLDKRGPEEVVFMDPDEPDDELDDVDGRDR